MPWFAMYCRAHYDGCLLRCLRCRSLNSMNRAKLTYKYTFTYSHRYTHYYSQVNSFSRVNKKNRNFLNDLTEISYSIIHILYTNIVFVMINIRIINELIIIINFSFQSLSFVKNQIISNHYTIDNGKWTLISSFWHNGGNKTVFYCFPLILDSNILSIVGAVGT